MPRNRLIAALFVAAVATTTAGCAVGTNAGTVNQPPSGNGAVVTTGPMAARGLLLVRGLDPTRASLIGTIVNTGSTDDAVTSVTLSTGTAAILSGTGTGSDGTNPALDLPGTSSTQFGYPDQSNILVFGLTVPSSNFVTVGINYRVAGTATVQVLTVPPVGIYAGLGPMTQVTQMSPDASPGTVASPSSSPTAS